MESRRTKIEKVRIVETAAVTALGNTLQDTWARIIKGDSGIGPIRRFPVETYESHIAATISDLRPMQERSIILGLIERLLAGLVTHNGVSCRRYFYYSFLVQIFLSYHPIMRE